MNFKRLAALAAGISAMGATAAQAHTGVGVAVGITAGFSHPAGGLDHVLAMLAVGVLAYQQGGRALWAIPLAFVAVMVMGGAMGMAGVPVPFVEQGIVGSVMILGAVVAMGWRMHLSMAVAMTGILAIFHGHAHGTEMPLDASAMSYALGFAVATAMLHVSGIAAAKSAQSVAERYAPLAVRFVGGVIAVSGLMLTA